MKMVTSGTKMEGGLVVVVVVVLVLVVVIVVVGVLFAYVS